MKFKETTLPNEIYREIFDNQHIGWDLSMSQDAVKGALMGMAKYLNFAKKKDKKKGCKLDSKTGAFVFGGICEWVPNKEDETKGAWSLYFTFDESEINNEHVDSVNLSDPVFKEIVANTSLYEVGIGYKAYEGIDFMPTILSSAFDCIKEWMRQNSELETEIQIEDVVTFQSEMNGEEVYIAVVPGALLKQFVKDDAATAEKADKPEEK